MKCFLGLPKEPRTRKLSPQNDFDDGRARRILCLRGNGESGPASARVAQWGGALLQSTNSFFLLLIQLVRCCKNDLGFGLTADAPFAETYFCACDEVVAMKLEDFVGGASTDGLHPRSSGSVIRHWECIFSAMEKTELERNW